MWRRLLTRMFASATGGPLCAIQVFEPLRHARKFWLALLNYLRRRRRKRLFERYAVHPTLLGNLFVSGKAQPQNQLNRSARFRLFFCLFALGLRFFAIVAFNLALGFFAVEFENQFLAQPECLLPTFQFMPGLLRLFLVRTKVKLHIDMCHELSLRCAPHQVKASKSLVASPLSPLSFLTLLVGARYIVSAPSSVIPTVGPLPRPRSGGILAKSFHSSNRWNSHLRPTEFSYSVRRGHDTLCPLFAIIRPGHRQCQSAKIASPQCVACSPWHRSIPHWWPPFPLPRECPAVPAVNAPSRYTTTLPQMVRPMIAIIKHRRSRPALCPAAVIPSAPSSRTLAFSSFHNLLFSSGRLLPKLFPPRPTRRSSLFCQILFPRLRELLFSYCRTSFYLIPTAPSQTRRTRGACKSRRA